MADVSVKEILRGVAQSMNFDDAGEGELQLEHAVEIVHRKAAGLIGGDAQGMDLAGREDQRQRDVIGDAVGLQLLQDGSLRRRSLEAGSDRLSLLEDLEQRAVEVSRLR